MAGKTMSGIGTESDSGPVQAEPTSEPTSTSTSSPTSTSTSPSSASSPEPSIHSAPTLVDGSKVAEALRNLRGQGHEGREARGGRSTDVGFKTSPPPEPARQPTPAPVLIGGPGSGPSATGAVPAAGAKPSETARNTAPLKESDRVSFGTMVGHELHHLLPDVGLNPGLRGTSVGRDVHLPALLNAHAPAPGPPVTDVLPVVPPVAAGDDDFSGGDHSFFDAEPLNTDYEPENPRGALYTRIAVFGAVAAVVAVVGVAWIRSRDAAQESQKEGESRVEQATTTLPPRAAPSPVAPPAPARQVEAPTSTIPSSVSIEPTPDHLRAPEPPPAPDHLRAPEPEINPPLPPSPPPVAAAPEPRPAPRPRVARPHEKPAPAKVATATMTKAPTASKPVTTIAITTPTKATPTSTKATATKVEPKPASSPTQPAARPRPPATTARAEAPSTKTAPPPATKPAAASAPAASATAKRGHGPAKRGKDPAYDPDGTLPLSFD